MRCPHGVYMHDWGYNCDICDGERDAERAADAAEETAREARKQTALLQEIERRLREQQGGKK